MIDQGDIEITEAGFWRQDLKGGALGRGSEGFDRLVRHPPDAVKATNLVVNLVSGPVLVRPLGLEPRTCGLRVRCSAN